MNCPRDGAAVASSRNKMQGLPSESSNAENVVSEVVFDENLRAVETRFDGEVRSKFSYDPDGYLTELTQSDRNGETTLHYLFDWKHGQVTEVMGPDGLVYQAKYDSNVNIKQITTDAGVTTYRYNPAGDLIEVKRPNKARARFEYTDDGQLARHIDAQGMITHLQYNPEGKLTEVTNPDGSVYRYEYNSLGLRTAADLGAKKITFSYDLLGRLTQTRTRQGQYEAVIQLELDEDNLTIAIKSPGDVTTQIDYDANGNIVSYGDGEQAHHYSYDRLGRFTSVKPMAGDVLYQTYAPGEADWRDRTDTRTAINLSPEHTASAVYGRQAEIFLGRSRAMKLSAARYEPSSKTLQAVSNLGFVAPDSSINAVLSRGRIDAMDDDSSARLTEFNRPSNSFFLPPEFQANNCNPVCDILSAIMSPSSQTVTAGQAAYFSLSATSRGGFYWDDGYQTCNPKADWNFGNGVYRPARSFGSSGTGTSHTTSQGVIYSTPGNFSVTAYAYCSCYGLAALASATVTAAAPTCAIDFTLPTSLQIDSAGSMPSITASSSGVTPSSANIAWAAEISHTAPSGCSGGPTFKSPSVTGTGASFSPTFPSNYGGTLTVKATCSATGYISKTVSKTSAITAVEPSNSSVVTEIGTVGSPFDSADLRRISCHESGLNQFSSGLPFYGPGGDAGLMQICFQRKNTDLWAWKSNIASGRSILTTAKNSAKNHLDSEVAGGATAYTTSMWRDESIHRYNAGTGSGNEYWEWNGSMWIIVDRGGLPAGGYVSAVKAKSSTCTS